MKRKDIGLLVSISVLAFLAVFSGKKVEVAPGSYVTQADLQEGKEIFSGLCRRCHGQRSRSGAPAIGNPTAWEARLRRGMEALADLSPACVPSEHSLNRRQTEAAVAYMLLKSR